MMAMKFFFLLFGCVTGRKDNASLRALLEEYPEISRRERAKPFGQGKFVTVVAERHGLGNRIGPVVGAFAIALTTRRALAIHWPADKRCHQRHKNCDPAGIDNLFVPPDGLEWRPPRRNLCQSGPWIVHGNDPKAVSRLRTIHGLGRGAAFREHLFNLCVQSDRDVAWGVTCHDDVAHRFPAPWVAYGALMAYLLRPHPKVLARIEDAKRRDGGVECALGVHLRKADDARKPSKVMSAGVVVAAFENARHLTTATGVYIAADDESLATRRALVSALVEAGAVMMARVTSKATRDTVDGLRDALADNFRLSSCYDLLPRGTGFSTFHDVALARAVFEHQWPESRIEDFVTHNNTSTGPHKFALTPAECPSKRLTESLSSWSSSSSSSSSSSRERKANNNATVADKPRAEELRLETPTETTTAPSLGGETSAAETTQYGGDEGWDLVDHTFLDDAPDAARGGERRYPRRNATPF